MPHVAERGLFDLFFTTDTPAARTDNLHAWSRLPLFMNVLEPVTLLTVGTTMRSRWTGPAADISTRRRSTRSLTKSATSSSTARSTSPGRRTIAGSPQRIADVMEEWFCNGAADGFMLQFHIMPRGLDLFVERVVPELQR